MQKEAELWQFIAERLERNQNVMLLVVAESSGSSPGRQGYKMAVASGGELCGSIGGGVMEVDLVEQSREILAIRSHASTGEVLNAELKNQIHRKNDPESSGMICSGKQTVLFKLLRPSEISEVHSATASISSHRRDLLTLSPLTFNVRPPCPGASNFGYTFDKRSENDFLYCEKLGPKNDLFIIGGGHCALALSELMSKMDFHISLFDDRPKLNTIDKNRFADKIKIINSYDRISEHISFASNAYVAVMTLGYKSDKIVIRDLVEKEFKYFGVLGSRAKMAVLLKDLENDGISSEKLARIRTPIGVPINSRTPEEIAVSIAAEIISIKNAS